MAFAMRWGEKSSYNYPMYLRSVVADWPQQSLQWAGLTCLMRIYTCLRCAGRDGEIRVSGTVGAPI